MRKLELNLEYTISVMEYENAHCGYRIWIHNSDQQILNTKTVTTLHNKNQTDKDMDQCRVVTDSGVLTPCDRR